MLNEVKSLLDVQVLDNELLEVKDQLALYPVIWEEVKAKLAAKKEAFDRAEKNEQRHKKERRRIEQKLRMYSDELRKNQSQQSGIKTSKEYEAINKQIEALKTKISSLEEQGLELISKDAEVEELVKAAAADLKKTEESYRAEKERIRVQFNEKKSCLVKFEAERQKLAARVEEATLATYQRISKRHPGSAVAPVRSDSCSGCHYHLVPNDLVQVHRSEKLVMCPNCGRILSEDEDYVPEEHATAG